MSLEAVLFDLDGTLADTAPDLVAVLNRLLAEEGLAPMPYALARNEVSNGALGLLRLGFATPPGAEVDPGLHARFLDHYARTLCVKTRLFINLSILSNVTNELGLAWGIVTNKPAALTEPLVAALGIQSKSACVVSGDTLPEKKPHPAPLEHAARCLGTEPQRCVYVGDAPRDIEAGHAAGMRTIAALYGYIRPGDDPTRWNADGCIGHPAELPGILARYKRSEGC